MDTLHDGVESMSDWSILSAYDHGNGLFIFLSSFKQIVTQPSMHVVVLQCRAVENHCTFFLSFSHVLFQLGYHLCFAFYF